MDSVGSDQDISGDGTAILKVESDALFVLRAAGTR